MQFEISRQELKTSRTRNWVPKVGGLRKLILEESHKSKYSIHPRNTKSYQDLRRQYWWPGMKKRIVKYISKCVICAPVKAEHQVPHGDAQSLHIPAGKWEDVTMDLIVGLPRTRRVEDILRSYVMDLGGSWDEHLPSVEFAYNNSYHSSIKMPPFEALYGRKCRTPLCWLEEGNTKLTGPEIVRVTNEKIGVTQANMKAAQDRQKSYSKKKRDRMSNKKKYFGKEELVIPYTDLRVETPNRLIEEPEAILVMQTKKLSNKEIDLRRYPDFTDLRKDSEDGIRLRRGDFNSLIFRKVVEESRENEREHGRRRISGRSSKELRLELVIPSLESAQIATDQDTAQALGTVRPRSGRGAPRRGGASNVIEPGKGKGIREA
ncbi:hypothetical protein L2E82_15496 [Cichorium intybus]|uniref:Uncharacterized protein n=1 Tax=Cichorium intybus TaxID=13427 RepID=A0ACB9F487_CICIN|nr:hypothetical protein L2E82_15496 [Cichorium intybus]